MTNSHVHCVIFNLLNLYHECNFFDQCMIDRLSSFEDYVIQIGQKTFTKAFNPLKRGTKNRKDNFVKAILGFKIVKNT